MGVQVCEFGRGLFSTSAITIPRFTCIGIESPILKLQLSNEDISLMQMSKQFVSALQQHANIVPVLHGMSRGDLNWKISAAGVESMGLELGGLSADEFSSLLQIYQVNCHAIRATESTKLNGLFPFIAQVANLKTTIAT